jgi:hypothetical protein
MISSSSSEEASMFTAAASVFPIPSVYTTTLAADADTDVGIQFAQSPENGGSSSSITVTSIAPESPLHGSEIAVGQMLLLVNGVVPSDVKHAESIMALGLEQASTLVFCTCDNAVGGNSDDTNDTNKNAHHHDSMTKMIAVSGSKLNPGVSFSSTRGRCLVQVSRIFAGGPFAAAAVTKTAARLQLSRSGSGGGKQISTIYALDGAKFRDYILEQAKKKFSGMSIVPDTTTTSDESSSFEDLPSFSIVYNKVVRARLVCDAETQHLSDPERFTNMVTASNGSAVTSADFSHKELAYHDFHSTIVLPFLHEFNKEMERQMAPLEEAACCEAWKYLDQYDSAVAKDGSSSEVSV